MRKIIHVDMDAFYAAVEQRDNPALRGKPIAIGSDSSRGVVATASYEARKYGIHSAMSSVMAKRRCRDLVFVPGNMEKYRAVSQQIRSIFHEYTDLVEPLSFDEAYLDITENTKNNPSATLIANEIRQKIFEITQLTCSAGVSYNKFLAKIASDVNKPNGTFVITPEQSEDFISKLKIERFFGIGKVTAEKMHKMGIFFGSDLRKLSLHRLNSEFGKAGAYYYQIVRGVDHRNVNPNRERKSVGGENTFSNDLAHLHELRKALVPIVEKVAERFNKVGLYGRTITLKIKMSDFSVHTKSRTLNEPILSQQALLKLSFQLIEEAYYQGMSVRLLGVSVSNFLSDEQEAIQLEIDWNNSI